MAFVMRVVVIHLLISLLLLQLIKGDDDTQKLLIKLEKPKLQKCRIDRIYQFGDSLSDTGNCLRESYCGSQTKTGKLPYGMNFYQNATGRCSDGFIILDYIG